MLPSLPYCCKSAQDEADEELSRVLETAVTFLDEAKGSEVKHGPGGI